MTKVLATGATGNVGSRVIRDLRSRGETVRAFVRDPDLASEKLGDGVELAVGDFSDAASVRRALEGAATVFLACANDPRQVEYETGVIDAAAKTGVGRIVKLSALGAGAGFPVAFWDWHTRIEARLRSSRVPAIVLRPNFYMTNLLGPAEEAARTGELFAPAGGARIAMVDPDDVAAVAAAVLSGGGNDGETYTLTGPETVTYDEVAAHLSAAVERKIDFVPVPDEAAREALAGAGMPGFVAGQIVALFGALRRGAYDRTTGTVHALAGRHPVSFRRFVRDHAHLLRAFDPA